MSEDEIYPEELKAEDEQALFLAFSEIRTKQQRDAQKIDVRPLVMKKIRGPRGGLIPILRYAPLIAAVVLLFFVGQSTAFAHTVKVQAPGGIELRVGDSWQESSGSFEQRGDFMARSTSSDAQLQAEHWNVLLKAKSLGHFSRDTIKLEYGQVEIDTEDIELQSPWASLELQGRARWGIFEENTMNKKAAALLGGAGAILALYAGAVQFKTGMGDQHLDGGSGALIDHEGEVRKISLSDAEAALRGGDGRGQLAENAKTNASQGQEGHDEKTGGYWDADAKTVRFELAGEVFDAQSGKAVENFVVEIKGLAVESFDAVSSFEERFEKSKDGKFRVSGFGLGQWRLRVSAEGYAPSVQTIDLRSATDDPYLVIPLSSGGELSGVVVDWRGDAVNGADIVLRECGLSRACPTATSDERGAFVLKGIPDEQVFSIEANHQKYGIARVPNLKVQKGHSEHIEVRLSGILEVSGVVYTGEKKAPKSGVRVRADGFETRSDEQGYYSLKMPLTDRPSVRVVSGSEAYPVEFASYPTSRSAARIVWVDAEDHVATLRKDFFLGMESATLFGKISLDGLSPAAGMKVLLRNNMGWKGDREHDTFPEQTLTDAQGRYRIENIPFKAAYVFSVEGPEGEETLGTVVIDEEKEIEANFVLGESTIRGHFIDRDTGENFTLDRYRCSRFGARNLSSQALFKARCLRNGAFEFRGLAAGSYRLELVGQSASHDVEFDAVDVDVLAGQLLDDLKVSLKAKHLLTWKARAVDESGHFVSGLTLRYHPNENSSRTTGLSLNAQGTVEFDIPEEITEMYLDAMGYESLKIDLESRNPNTVVDATMRRER